MRAVYIYGYASQVGMLKHCIVWLVDRIVKKKDFDLIKHLT